MALAYCLRTIEARDDARLTVYGEYLAAHPPTHEVVIQERTSWLAPTASSAGGGSAGATAGRIPGWSQAWREPLREAVDMVRDTLAPRSAEALERLVHDPGGTDDAVDLVLGRWSDEAVEILLPARARDLALMSGGGS